MKVKTLILGAGISGVSFAHFLEQKRDTDYLILEKSDRAGGLCKSFKVGDFVFDYSGHFLHFKDSEMKAYIESLLEGTDVKFTEFERRAGILIDIAARQYLVDYPFQANIHQLPQNTFIQCLTDLYDTTSPTAYMHANDNFAKMTEAAFGNKITDLFFRPYNEKLYRTKLEDLDADAMKRFIPKVSFDDVMENFKKQENFGYNSTFLYSPTTGIQGLVDAFKPEKLNIRYREAVLIINLKDKIVETSDETYFYDTLINTLPLNYFCEMSGVHTELPYVTVDVYNLGFDKKENVLDVAWLYIPSKDQSFYRVGFYDYMSKIDKTSLYVEVSRKPGEEKKETSQIISELKSAKIITEDANLIAEQTLTMDPAYVILEKNTEKKVNNIRQHLLKKHDTHLLGRYGQWIYNSIEENILAAKDLASQL